MYNESTTVVQDDAPLRGDWRKPSLYILHYILEERPLYTLYI